MPEPKDTRKRLKWNGFIWIACAILAPGIPVMSTAQEVVVASTSLAGAIARAAGAKEVRVLTPAEVKHPPEYELKPSDLRKFEGAGVVVYAGYERMVSKLLETSRDKNIIAVRIDTATSPENLVAQVGNVAKVLKTDKEAQAWKVRFLGEVNSLQRGLSPFSGKRAVVHHQAQAFSRWAGLFILQVIRPGELSPKAVADALAKRPDLVVDIFHFPTAKTVADNAKCKYIQVINFPGVENTETLEDVFRYNAAQLRKAF